MGYYAIKFEQIRQEKSMADLLDALVRGFKKFGINYYLVGALARDVWMRGIKDTEVFNDLKKYLIKQEGFVPYSENSFVLIWKDKRQINLLPFGEIEQEGKVTVKGTGLTTINVDGFTEVYAAGLPEAQLEGSIRFKFCTLPGIVILKLIAWDDRPEIRRDDIIDISDILHHFFNIFDEMIWSQHNDLFDEGVELIEISAQVLGREIGKILNLNSKVRERVLGILSKNTSEPSNLGSIMTSYFQNDEAGNIKLLKRIKAGIKEIK